MEKVAAEDQPRSSSYVIEGASQQNPEQDNIPHEPLVPANYLEIADRQLQSLELDYNEVLKYNMQAEMPSVSTGRLRCKLNLHM